MLTLLTKRCALHRITAGLDVSLLRSICGNLPTSDGECDPFIEGGFEGIGFFIYSMRSLHAFNVTLTVFFQSLRTVMYSNPT